jgi:hypothetical protein
MYSMVRVLVRVCLCLSYRDGRLAGKEDAERQQRGQKEAAALTRAARVDIHDRLLGGATSAEARGHHRADVRRGDQQTANVGEAGQRRDDAARDNAARRGDLGVLRASEREKERTRDPTFACRPEKKDAKENKYSAK